DDVEIPITHHIQAYRQTILTRGERCLRPRPQRCCPFSVKRNHSRGGDTADPGNGSQTVERGLQEGAAALLIVTVVPQLQLHREDVARIESDVERTRCCEAAREQYGTRNQYEGERDLRGDW